MTASSDDPALVRRAKDGDLDAFDALVQRHTAGVYRIALRMLADRDDAEDITQDVFLQAWRSLGAFRAESAFKTWVFRIAVNRCLNRLQRQRPTEPLDQDIASTVDDPQRVVETRAGLRAVGRALAQLPPEQRAALVLREFEGCAYAEIADILNVSLPAVKGRLLRARVAVIEALRAWT